MRNTPGPMKGGVLRSRIIFKRLLLRVKILMRLRIRPWLLPYCIARQNFLKEQKFKYMLKLSFYFDSVRFTRTSILLKI
jgi:hypothetical protein